MATFYVDSSVLVKRHAFESGTPWVQALTDPGQGNRIITSRVTVVEVISALQRKQRDGDLTPDECSRLRADFLAVCTHEYHLVDVTTPILDRALLLVQRRTLRAYDAVQLASALLTTSALQAGRFPPLTFLASDRQLLRAAQAEGIAVDDPQRHA